MSSVYFPLAFQSHSFADWVRNPYIQAGKNFAAIFSFKACTDYSSFKQLTAHKIKLIASTLLLIAPLLNTIAFFAIRYLLPGSEPRSFLNRPQTFSSLEAENQTKFLEGLRPFFEVRDVRGDGNCAPRAVINCLHPQIKGDPAKENRLIETLRADLVEHIKKREQKFIRFFITDGTSQSIFQDYLADVGKNGTWLGQLELRALSDMLARPIWIYQANGTTTEKPGSPPMPIAQLRIGEDKYAKKTPIRICYVNGNHYMALLPLKAKDFPAATA